MVDQPLTETGSWFELRGFDINTQAEPIMRYWQLSEALSRMSRRIKKRYPGQARILARASEDICFEFYNQFDEAQKFAVAMKKDAHRQDLKVLLEQREAEKLLSNGESGC